MIRVSSEKIIYTFKFIIKPYFVSVQKQFSSSINTKLNILGLYQIIGGASGVLLTIRILAKAGQITGLIALIFLLFFFLYGFSTCCGILLLGKNYKTGLSLSLVNQALQIINFSFLGYTYLYISGFMLNLGLGYSSGLLSSGLKFGFYFGVMSKWQFSIASKDYSFDLYLNLAAVYVIYFINKLRGAIKLYKTEIAGDNPDINEVFADL